MESQQFRLIRIAISKSDHHLRVVHSRKVEPGLQRPRERLGQTQRHALATLRPIFEVDVETYDVVSGGRQISIFIFVGACHTATKRARDFRPLRFVYFQTEAPVSGYRLERVAIGLVSRAPVRDFNDHQPVFRIRQLGIGVENPSAAKLLHIALTFEDHLPADRFLVIQLRLALGFSLIKMRGSIKVGLAVRGRVLGRDVFFGPKAFPSLVGVIVRDHHRLRHDVRMARQFEH
ncbi:hypothetical protein AWB82_07275 [Caballeronia glebae]|uniref:Uncharacterized protein n=1 Tax=Caballeronia glebae TaxID=1777143 RepID=A0A158DX59_9BURK|nr:hypothetical protein AWB82_07275 [Caballeronia glebae]